MDQTKVTLIAHCLCMWTGVMKVNFSEKKKIQNIWNRRLTRFYAMRGAFDSRQAACCISSPSIMTRYNRNYGFFFSFSLVQSSRDVRSTVCAQFPTPRERAIDLAVECRRSATRSRVRFEQILHLNILRLKYVRYTVHIYIRAKCIYTKRRYLSIYSNIQMKWDFMHSSVQCAMRCMHREMICEYVCIRRERVCLCVHSQTHVSTRVQFMHYQPVTDTIIQLLIQIRSIEIITQTPCVCMCVRVC